jgi:PIN domain nuclease of toxin-antitoxin system
MAKRVAINVILLDTSSLFWLSSRRDLLSAGAMAAIRSNTDQLVVSSISAYEIGVKTKLQKLELPLSPRAWFDAVLQGYHITEIPVSVDIALRATELDWSHRDPFDRIIVATALESGVAVVTSDRWIRGFAAVRTVW